MYILYIVHYMVWKRIQRRPMASKVNENAREWNANLLYGLNQGSNASSISKNYIYSLLHSNSHCVEVYMQFKVLVPCLQVFFPFGRTYAIIDGERERDRLSTRLENITLPWPDRLDFETKRYCSQTIETDSIFNEFLFLFTD